MAPAPPTLASPEIATVNANGALTGEQRRALGRDLYREQGKKLAMGVAWIAISLVMLRILLPVARSLIPMLLTDNHRGSRPIRLGDTTVALPLWAVLKWFLVLLALVVCRGLLRARQATGRLPAPAARPAPWDGRIGRGRGTAVR